MKINVNSISILILIFAISLVSCQKDQPTNKVLENQIFTVAIDAGHGGRDPGAIGPNELLEKDVTLSIAKRIAATLEEDGFNAILTRSVDEFVSLEDRIELAKKSQADILISIHTNNSKNTEKGGIATYYNEHNNSRVLVLDSLFHVEAKQLTSITDLGGKDANFYIIKNSICPAIDIEVGYISNPSESKLISNAAFQNEVSEVIKNCVRKYVTLVN